jgi:hypothetical protein
MRGKSLLALQASVAVEGLVADQETYVSEYCPFKTESRLALRVLIITLSSLPTFSSLNNGNG